jgi:hypothetical protein
VLSYVMMALVFALYRVVAQWTGGLELSLSGGSEVAG